MVVVEFSAEEMKKLIDISKDEMIDGLNELGAPSEYEPELKKILAELTPNRPDWYSMEGLARALRSYYTGKRPKYHTKKSEYKVIVDPSVEKIRPYTVCGVIKNLNFDDQKIKDMVLLQEKLLGTLGRRVKRFGIGVYPLHAIRFPITYKTMKPKDIRYVPLGYDKEMGADQILEQHKKGMQYGSLIKGQKEYPVFVDASSKIMALVPVVNSAETGKVDESTNDLFIEVTGTDIHACKAALNILVCTFIDMGGEAYEVDVEYKKEKIKTPDLSEKKMKLNLEEVEKVLGIRLDEKEAGKLLGKMGYGYEKGIVIMPPYRADILSSIDIIEDIAIAYGYNNFEFTTPDFFSAGEKIGRHSGADVVLRGMGFLETTTFILTNKEKLAAGGFETHVVEISNPNNVEYTVVRPTLAVDMLDTFALNKMKGLPQKFYEIGIVQEKDQTKKKICFGLTDKTVEFSDARGVLQSLLKQNNIEFSLEKTKLPLFEEDISSKVVVGGKDIGIFGKVNKRVAERFGLTHDTYVCELEI